VIIRDTSRIATKEFADRKFVRISMLDVCPSGLVTYPYDHGKRTAEAMLGGALTGLWDKLDAGSVIRGLPTGFRRDSISIEAFSLYYSCTSSLQSCPSDLVSKIPK